MVGVSGVSLTVIGELRKCPVLLNGYKYYANLVVTKLDTVDAILGMDFLKAYDVTINLRRVRLKLLRTRAVRRRRRWSAPPSSEMRR